MPISLIYLAVIITWSTTPIGIKLSNDSLTPFAAASLRLLVAALGAMVIVTLWRRKSQIQWRHSSLYFAASLGLFPCMPLVYWAAQYIPSGLISVVFALSPLSTGLLSIVILRENPFTPVKLLALGIALAGLGVVLIDQASISEQAGWGITAMLGSTLIFSLSSVLLKRINSQADAFEQTYGSLLFALPGFLLAWYVLDGQIPETISTTSWLGTLYLALFGSLAGFFGFYYLLRHVSLTTVSLIPLITPILALWIGVIFANEEITQKTLFGTLMIVSALFLHESNQLQRKKTLLPPPQ